MPRSPGGGQTLLLDVRDDTWAKMRPDPETGARLVEVLPRLGDPVTRGAVWLSVRDVFDDAEVAPSLALDLLAAAVPGEVSDVAVRGLLTWAHG